MVSQSEIGDVEQGRRNPSLIFWVSSTHYDVWSSTHHSTNLALDDALIEEARKVGADTPAWSVACPKADENAAREQSLHLAWSRKLVSGHVGCAVALSAAASILPAIVIF